MFGHAFFGAAFFGAAYFGPASGPVVVEVDALSASTSSAPRLSATINTHPMSNKLTVGSTNTVALKGLRDDETRLYLNNATVVLTAIFDATLTPVPGTQNIAMPYISGVGRSILYRGAIPHTAALVADQTYTRRITATDAAGNVRVFDKVIVAEAG